MLRIQQRLISFSIVSHKIAYNAKDYYRDSTLNFYPVVGLKDIKLGTISFNQPNNQNFLTVEMIDEIFRFLNSYQHDHSVENVWIQNRGSMFLGGLSFQQLAQKPDYLDKLYKMTALVAKLNKPIFSYATGGVRNVGAYVLSMAAVALTDQSASLRIDQVSKGFIPVAGGSHRLSRLPAKIGFYLALTGKKLNSNEMSRLGLITGIVKQGSSSKQMRTNISRSNLFFRQKLQVSMKDQRDNEFIQWHKVLRKKNRLRSQLQINQSDIIGSQDNVFAKFAMNQYRLAQINFQNAKKPFNSFSEKPGRKINNYFKLRHEKAYEYLQKEGFIQKSDFEDVRLPRFQIDKIIKFFSRDSLHEVVKLLENDNTEWSKDTLKHMRQMDPLAAVLTFQLLNRAEVLSWDQCLELEYTVSKRILANSKLSLKQTYAGSKFVLINKYSDLKIEDVSKENEIEQYFGPAKTEQQKLELDVPLYSLYPTSDYRSIPDSARLAMNQQFFDDIHLNNQQRQMKRWLQNQKIDYRHKSYDIHLLRQKIYKKQEYEFVQQNETKRLQYITNNSRVLNNFMSERNSCIDNMSNQDMEKFLTQTTKTIFNDGIKSRFQEFEKTAAIMGKQKKLQIFKNLRKSLIRKIVINGTELESQLIDKSESFRGPVYFDNQGKSVYETKNPNLKVYQPLERLADEIANNGQLSQEFIQNQGALPVAKDLGLNVSQSGRERWLRGIQQRIAKRYQQSPAVWKRAFEYQEMVRQAGKTSQQLAQYMQWDRAAFYNTIMNAPSVQKTYNEVGQKYLDQMSQQRQKQKTSLRTEMVLSQTFSNEYFELQYSQSQSKATHDSSKFIKEELVPKFALSKELEKFMGPTLEMVLKHFEEKYFQEAFKEKKIEFGDFDKFIYEARDKEFVQLYKNDILFVYSYFAILKIKEVLHNLKLNGVPQRPEDLHQFFRQNNIEFKTDRDVQFMNRVISKFLFNMLDLHTYTKPKILLPQNKLLDFMNRLKIFRQTQKKSVFPLSFQSLLLMIGKDRTRVYNKAINEYIPTEPQFLLDMANNNTKDQLDSQLALRGNHASSIYLLENSVTGQHLQKKTLIAGYQYYLGLFDNFVQRASGKYNFVNCETANLDIQKLRTQMGNIINLKQTGQQWLQRITKVAVKNFFNVRLQYEKTLTKGELLAFDQQMKQILNPQTFRLVLKYFLQSEVQQTKALFQQTRKYSYKSDVSDMNEQLYCEIRKNVKNPDAFKRLNNLKMAMNVQSDYFKSSQNKLATQEQKEDLVEQKKQFFSYERFPKQTYKRIVDESMSYGQEKNFEKYLNPIKDREMDSKHYKKQIRFAYDERQTNFKKQQKFTGFEEELKALKGTVANNSTDKEQIDTLYRKIENLL